MSNTSGARGIKNNNPGNIIQSKIQWLGKLSPSTDPTFEVFDTASHGLRALAKLLLNYSDFHEVNTVAAIINRWAPPVENDTGAYVEAVAKALKLTTKEAVELKLNLHDFPTLLKFTTAIIQHENGYQPYPDALLTEAVQSALGKYYRVLATEVLTGIAEEKAKQIKLEFELTGARVTTSKEPDGLYTIVSVQPI